MEARLKRRTPRRLLQPGALLSDDEGDDPSDSDGVHLRRGQPLIVLVGALDVQQRVVALQPLCLNIAEASVKAETIAVAAITESGKFTATHEHEPSPKSFTQLLERISGKALVVSFEDLDKHPKIIDALSEHVRKPYPGGVLVMVSHQWNSDNTEKERELRKHCLFFQQNLAVPPKQK
jgi:hypothetical protein